MFYRLVHSWWCSTAVWTVSVKTWAYLLKQVKYLTKIYSVYTIILASSSLETQKLDGMFGFHLFFDIWYNLDDRAVSFTRRPHLSPRKFLLTRFFQKLSGSHGYWKRTGTCHLKISKDPIGNRTRHLPSCGEVPQQTYFGNPSEA
jgi:hypothetical protein